MKKIEIIGGSDHYKTWLGEELIKKIEETTGLIIFTGGPDVPPTLYGEDNVRSAVNMNRTEREIRIYKEAVRQKIPVLGICYGSQLVTALQPNGKIIQNVTGHNRGSHSIFSTEDYEEYEMTSTHHQMMYPFNIENYEILAHTVGMLSKEYIYDKGDYKDIYLEAEIVYYPDKNTLAIQGHPEFSTCPEKTREFCRKLIKKYLLKE